MSTLMTTPSLLQAAGLMLQAIGERWAALRRRAQDRQALSEMSAHELSDLGLGRGEIAYLTAPTTLARWPD